MLLVGSRAIVHHFPEFRRPRDWDLVGRDDDVARLDRLLPRAAKHLQRREKVSYSYDGVLVEVAVASATPYWLRVHDAFADEPVIDEPTLGALRVAPPAFLLITKQCGLVYRIAHWHKNLEDLYFLRERVGTITDAVAALLPEALADSRRMFAERHRKAVGVPDPCHPSLEAPADPLRHRALHERLALGAAAACDEPRAWEGFPERPAPERRALLVDLFAEEVMVLAAEQAHAPRDGEAHDEGELVTTISRHLCTGALPEHLRYFGVNHYREIRARIREGFLARAADLRRADTFRPCNP